MVYFGGQGKLGHLGHACYLVSVATDAQGLHNGIGLAICPVYLSLEEGGATWGPGSPAPPKFPPPSPGGLLLSGSPPPSILPPVLVEVSHRIQTPSTHCPNGQFSDCGIWGPFLSLDPSQQRVGSGQLTSLMTRNPQRN